MNGGVVVWCWCDSGGGQEVFWLVCRHSCNAPNTRTSGGPLHTTTKHAQAQAQAQAQAPPPGAEQQTPTAPAPGWRWGRPWTWSPPRAAPRRPGRSRPCRACGRGCTRGRRRRRPVLFALLYYVQVAVVLYACVICWQGACMAGQSGGRRRACNGMRAAWSHACVKARHARANKQPVAAVQLLAPLTRSGSGAGLASSSFLSCCSLLSSGMAAAGCWLLPTAAAAAAAAAAARSAKGSKREAAGRLCAAADADPPPCRERRRVPRAQPPRGAGLSPADGAAERERGPRERALLWRRARSDEAGAAAAGIEGCCAAARLCVGRERPALACSFECVSRVQKEERVVSIENARQKKRSGSGSGAARALAHGAHAACAHAHAHSVAFA